MTLDANWIAVPMRARPPHPRSELARAGFYPNHIRALLDSTMRTHREPGIPRDAHKRIRAYARANGPVAFHAVRGRHAPRLRAPMAHGPDARPRQLATELAHTATRDRNLEEQQAYVPAADDGDYVGAPESTGATDGECRVTRVLGGVRWSRPSWTGARSWRTKPAGTDRPLARRRARDPRGHVGARTFL